MELIYNKGLHMSTNIEKKEAQGLPGFKPAVVYHATFQVLNKLLHILAVNQVKIINPAGFKGTVFNGLENTLPGEGGHLPHLSDRHVVRQFKNVGVRNFHLINEINIFSNYSNINL